MVLPTTWLSAVLLLVLSFLCLGSWANTFKATGSRWRFELFSIDFAVGALIVGVVAAYTLGTLGSDLSFSDRMLVAGRTNQALGIVAGAIFALGNMLFLAAITLLGMSAAFPLCIGSAVLIGALFQIPTAQPVWLAIGLAFLICGMFLAIVAIRIDKASVRAPAPKPGIRGPERKPSRGGKGIIVGVISGIVLGCFFPVAQRGTSGDFGLGPYAGLLLIGIALLVSTLVLNLYFMNMAISGGPIGFNAYFNGLPRQHFLGFGGGALWAIGMLAAGLAMSVPANVELDAALRTFIPLASVALAVFWGFVKWKEFRAAPKSGRVRTLVVLSTIFFLGGIALLGLAARQLNVVSQ